MTFIKCDVSKEEEINNCFQEALNRIKRIDVIINNAGIMDDSIDAWRTASDVNWVRKQIHSYKCNSSNNNYSMVLNSNYYSDIPS